MAENEPSWKRFSNFEGPDPSVEHEALRRWNLEKAAMAESLQGGGGHLQQTPRKMKYRGYRIGGVTVK